MVNCDKNMGRFEKRRSIFLKGKKVKHIGKEIGRITREGKKKPTSLFTVDEKKKWDRKDCRRVKNVGLGSSNN